MEIILLKILRILDKYGRTDEKCSIHINISFEDASELVSQVIPPRSIKPVGFANYSYRDNFKEDIINALYGVR